MALVDRNGRYIRHNGFFASGKSARISNGCESYNADSGVWSGDTGSRCNCGRCGMIENNVPAVFAVIGRCCNANSLQHQSDKCRTNSGGRDVIRAAVIVANGNGSGDTNVRRRTIDIQRDKSDSFDRSGCGCTCANNRYQENRKASCHNSHTFKRISYSHRPIEDSAVDDVRISNNTNVLNMTHIRINDVTVREESDLDDLDAPNYGGSDTSTTHVYSTLGDECSDNDDDEITRRKMVARQPPPLPQNPPPPLPPRPRLLVPPTKTMVTVGSSPNDSSSGIASDTPSNHSPESGTRFYHHHQLSNTHYVHEKANPDTGQCKADIHYESHRHKLNYGQPKDRRPIICTENLYSCIPQLSIPPSRTVCNGISPETRQSDRHESGSSCRSFSYSSTSDNSHTEYVHMQGNSIYDGQTSCKNHRNNDQHLAVRSSYDSRESRLSPSVRQQVQQRGQTSDCPCGYTIHRTSQCKTSHSYSPYIHTDPDCTPNNSPYRRMTTFSPSPMKQNSSFSDVSPNDSPVFPANNGFTYSTSSCPNLEFIETALYHMRLRTSDSDSCDDTYKIIPTSPVNNKSKLLPKPAYFDLLPDVVILKIFSYLTSEWLCVSTRVCRRWYNLCWSDSLWNNITINNEHVDIDKALRALTKRLSFETPDVCMQLERVRLIGTHKLTDTGLHMIARRCPELRQLELQGSGNISNVSIADIMSSCANLEYLDVTGCSRVTCVSLTDSALRKASSQHLRKIYLRHLDMTDCHALQDLGLQIIATQCTHLQLLYLRRCVLITDVGLQWISRYCCSLNELSISDCRKITDVGITSLCNLDSNLRYLSVAKCDQVSDVGIKDLASCCTRLRYLNMRGCEGVSDDSLEMIAKHCPRMRSLDLGKCDISDDGLMILADHCPQLRKLSVKSCDAVTDEGIIKIAYKCPQLQQLNIQGCHLSMEAYKAIKRHCKKCIIEHTNPGFCI